MHNITPVNILEKGDTELLNIIEKELEGNWDVVKTAYCDWQTGTSKKQIRGTEKK